MLTPDSDNLPIALTVAGSDSGGGAGVQADLKVFHRFRVFGVSAITAITAQNTASVFNWTAVDPAMVRAQIDAIVEDMKPLAMKTGMLGNGAVALAVAAAIRAHALHPYVLDPVMVATAGVQLSHHTLFPVIKDKLIGMADIITPNIYEARGLAGKSIDTIEDMQEAARLLVRHYGAKAALIKGGHLPSHDETVTDVFYERGGKICLLESRRLRIPRVHGAGCTLSAAITANLAKGMPTLKAVQHARTFVQEALITAVPVGHGARPLNHWA